MSTSKYWMNMSKFEPAKAAQTLLALIVANIIRGLPLVTHFNLNFIILILSLGWPVLSYLLTYNTIFYNYKLIGSKPVKMQRRL